MSSSPWRADLEAEVSAAARGAAAILLVDDHRANLTALEATLAPLGHKLVKAASGEEALRLALEEDFAAVLMDVRMPGMSGLEATSLLRKQARHQRTPVILMTAAEGEQDEVLDAYAHGAVDYLKKPYSPAVVRSKVSVFVDLFLAREQVRRQATLLQARELALLQGTLREHEQALRETEAEKELFFQLAPDMFAVTDLEARFRRVNPAFPKTLGWAAQELDQKPLLELVHPEDVADAREKLRELGRGLSTVRFETRYRCKDGSHKWLSWAATAVLARGLCYAAARDITQEKQAEQALERALTRESSARADAEEQKRVLRLLVEQSGDAIIMADEHGMLRVFNPEAERQHGVTQQEVQAKDWARTFGLYRLDGTPLTLEETPLHRAVRGENVRGAEWLVRRPDGSQRILAGTASPLRRHDGSAAGGVLIARDETERRLAEAQRIQRSRHNALFGDVGLTLTEPAETSQVLQSCVEAIVRHLDAAFARIWLLNEADQVLELCASAGLYTHTNGLHARVPVGQLKIGLIARERAPHVTNQVLGDPRVGNQEWAKKEGMVAFAGYPLLIGERLIGVLAMFSRKVLTEEAVQTLERVAATLSLGIRRISVEEELRQLNQSLERRVQERTAQLTEVNRELESFSYSVSHDLRAPLRHIMGFSQLLERRAGALLDEKAKGYVRTISESAHRGGQLVDDLLSFSRMGRTELRRTNVPLSPLVEEVRRELSAEFEGRVVHWELGELPEVQGDPAMLRLVIKNLLSNALKYSKPKPEARIEVKAQREAGEVHVWVKDNGVGFEMQHVGQLFGVFQRLHTSEQFEGTGIGLANVRRVVSRHGGRTWAEGELEHGATFHFTLPDAEPRGVSN